MVREKRGKKRHGGSQSKEKKEKVCYNEKTEKHNKIIVFLSLVAAINWFDSILL